MAASMAENSVLRKAENLAEKMAEWSAGHSVDYLASRMAAHLVAPWVSYSVGRWASRWAGRMDELMVDWRDALKAELSDNPMVDRMDGHWAAR